MQSCLAIDKGKAETVLFKICLCLWICRDSKILKSDILLPIGRTYYCKVTNMYIGIAGKSMVSNTALAWLGNEDVRPRTNSSMLKDPDVKSATGRANAARRALRATVFIYYTGSQSTREVVLVKKNGRYALSIA